MSEWIKAKLKNLTTKIGSGATPRGSQEAYKTEGISLIRSQISSFKYKEREASKSIRNIVKSSKSQTFRYFEH